MKQFSSNIIFSSGLKCLSLFVFIIYSHLSSAAITDMNVDCSAAIAELEASNGTVADPTLCDISSSTGQVVLPTANMGYFLLGLLDASTGTGNIDSSADPTDFYTCTQNGSTTSCTLGNNDNALPVECSFDSASNSWNCGLQNAPEVFSIGCDGTAGTCRLQSNTDILFDKLPTNLSPNMASLAESFLTCATQNTFGSFADVCNTVVGLLISGDPADIGTALNIIETLQPINPDASIDISSTNLRQAQHTISDRLSRLRSGINIAGEVQNNQYMVNNEWHDAGSLFAQNAEAKNDASMNVSKNISEYGKLGFFINAAIITAEQTGDIELAADTDASVLTLGIDYRITDQIIGGLAFNINQSETDIDHGAITSGELESEGFSFLLYGSFYQDDWFVDASLTMGGDQYDQTRESGGIDVYETTFNGDHTSLAIQGGYDFRIQSFNITPFAQFTTGKINADGYTEKLVNGAGNTGAAIAIEDQDSDIGSFNLGSHFRYILNTNNGVIIPSASLTLVNDLEDDAQQVSGRFVGNYSAEGGFTFETNEVDSSYMIIGLGISGQFKNGFAGFANFETIEGYDNYDQNRITFGVRFEM